MTTDEIPATPQDPARETPAALSRGTLVGPYMIVERVGSGGMGVVYSAYDPELDRKVAVKLLRSDGHSDAAQARLVREAQAMARLSHPSVITVFHAGTFGDAASALRNAPRSTLSL